MGGTKSADEITLVIIKVDGCLQDFDVARVVNRSSIKLRHAHTSETDSADLKSAVAKRFWGVCHDSISWYDWRLRVLVEREPVIMQKLLNTIFVVS